MNTLILLLAAGVGNPPEIPLVCAVPTAEKGEVRGGPPLKHTFQLAHRGGAGTLTITKVETGCGCLRQALQRTVLQPGETTALTIEVNTLTQPDGPNRWQLSVGYKFEKPGTPPVTGDVLLQITATLSREVSVVPAQLGFSTTGEASHVVVLTDKRGQPLNVIRAVASSPHLKVEIAPRQVDPMKRTTQSVTIKLASDTPEGHRDEAVILQTDDPDYPEFRLPVRVLKRSAGAVVASPEAVVVRLGAGQDEVSTLVRLRAEDGKTVAVAGVDSDHPGVVVKWSPDPGVVSAVRVTVTDKAAAQAGGCKVRVRLKEPTIQEVVIPVAWTAIKK